MKPSFLANKVSIYAIPGLLKGTKVADLNRPQMMTTRIRDIVCQYYDIDPATILTTKSRKRELVFARQLIMYFMRKYTKMSLKSIGSEFAGTSNGKKKDHTTVIHSIRTVNNLMDTDEGIRTQVKHIEIKMM